MAGFTATAFVRMLRLKRDALRSELLLLRANQDTAAFLVQQHVAALDAANDLLMEAVKLQNAIVNEHEWTIQRDGSVRVNSPVVVNPLPKTAEMEGL